jgi:hypothetical protein
MKAMEQSLMKLARQIPDDCATAVKKLRARLHSSEYQLRVHKKKALALTQLAAKTLPKGLHCLPLRLTTEYYNLNFLSYNSQIEISLKTLDYTITQYSQITYWQQPLL